VEKLTQPSMALVRKPHRLETQASVCLHRRLRADRNITNHNIKLMHLYCYLYNLQLRK